MFRSNPWTVVCYDSPYTSKIWVPPIDEIRHANAELVASLAQGIHGIDDQVGKDLS